MAPPGWGGATPYASSAFPLRQHVLQSFAPPRSSRPIGTAEPQNGHRTPFLHGVFAPYGANPGGANPGSSFAFVHHGTDRVLDRFDKPLDWGPLRGGRRYYFLVERSQRVVVTY